MAWNTAKKSSSHLSSRQRRRLQQDQQQVCQKNLIKIACGFLAIYLFAGGDTGVDPTASSLLTLQNASSSALSSSLSSFATSGTTPQQSSSSSSSPPSSLPTTIAYAISLIKCGDHQSNEAGLVDAALVLRHSVHLTSVQNPASGSNYDYQMYAIVHRQAESCSGVLRQAGFTIVVVDPPLQPSSITGSDFLKRSIHREWCCGSDEFIKIYAYQLPTNPTTGQYDPIVVHVDIDFAFFQPMDHLFDAMLYDKDSVQGKAARAKTELERPDDRNNLPDRIDAYITRDYPQLRPGRIPGYQAGFLIARRDPTVLPQAVQVIQTHTYAEGFALDNGWGNKGYGGYVGSMAMQGLLAYFYDQIRPNTSVELHSCRYNHMGMDNLYRAPPNFQATGGYQQWVGKCRSTRPDCEDCTTTDVSKIYSIHYTQCRKPWNCVGMANNDPNLPKGLKGIDTNAGKFDHCMKLTRKWHEVRVDLERRLLTHTEDDKILMGMRGLYKHDIFLGHCTAEGGGGYTGIQATPETFHKIPTLYEKLKSSF